MTAYSLSLCALLGALVGQTAALWICLELMLRQAISGRQRLIWCALALSALSLTIHHSHALELALRSGLYDLHQAILACLAGCLSGLALYGIRQHPA